jgi:folate-binding protein YgfZ
MNELYLHGLHQGMNARFTEVNGVEVVESYGDPVVEHAALIEAAGVVDLSGRSRLCLGGADRVKFLHGQVTNDVNRLKPGQGCYAALVSAKGKMQSDLNIYSLPDELLLDFEPGYAAAVAERLEKYIIADDVQVVDVAPQFGLISVQGPKAEVLLQGWEPGAELPRNPMNFVARKDERLGEVYVMNRPRTGSSGYDLIVPNAVLAEVADKLLEAANQAGGRFCGWGALELARIEAGIPRFGADMDESNLAPETGIEDRAISYSKGCYIGQEVIARIRTYGQVAKTLRGLRLAENLNPGPARGDKLLKEGKEAGYVTSAVASPVLKASIALGYVRREHNQMGTELTLRTAGGETSATIVSLPFRSSPPFP